jgi:hypothetical protein
MDWHIKSLHFEAPKQEPLDCEAIVTSMVGETHKLVRHVFRKKLGEAKRMPNFKNLDGAQKSSFSKFLFMKAWAFMHAVKKGDAFFIYTLPTTNVGSQQHEIPSQYKNYNDVFEKKNVDILPKHQPYDCTIDLKKSAQPHLDPSIICHKMNLQLFVSTSTRISKKGSFNILKSLASALILFVNNKDGSLWMHVDY